LAIHFPFHSMAHVGEAVMRIERMIVAVVVSVLAMFAVQGTAVADDPGLTHNGTELTHN
jgi:hypothetical protein